MLLDAWPLTIVSGRQYTNEASIPSQRKITTGFCDQNRYTVVEEFVEAKTATDDRRPVLQEMIDRACAVDHPYDAIVFYAFNRFFRNVAEMELTIRKLRKHNVDVVSVTQPTGDDPSQILVRQIIVAFDEHTSRGNIEEHGSGHARVRKAGLLEWRDPALGLQDHRG